MRELLAWLLVLVLAVTCVVLWRSVGQCQDNLVGVLIEVAKFAVR